MAGRIALFLLTGLLAASAAQAAPTRTEVSPGVWLFQTPPHSDVGLDGNSVAIVSNDGVLLFDANGTPDAAREVLAELRKITPQPVRWLVYSHWHWDHWYGAEVYAQAFPGLEIVSHEATRALMAGPAIAFNQPGLDEQLPGHIAQVDTALAKARREDPASERVKRLTAHLEQDKAFLAQKRGFEPQLAGITFRDSLTIHLGERVIKLLHHDRAITPGDTYLYLPKDHVVITGDLLINPVTFALFCYPAGWIATLEQIDALDASWIIPGHGAAMKDERVLHATTALLERERDLALAAKAQGKTVEEAKSAILADTRVLDLRTALIGADEAQREAFALYLVEWFVKRVYQEADGPLDDSIPRLN